MESKTRERDGSYVPWTWETPLGDALITDAGLDGDCFTLELDCSAVCVHPSRHLRRLRFEGCEVRGEADLKGRYWLRETLSPAGNRNRLLLTTEDGKGRHKRTTEILYSAVSCLL